MDTSRVYAGIIGLFFITVIYFFGDPIVSGRLYDIAYEVKPELADTYVTGWTRVLPVFVVACFYMIISGGRTEDYPSRYSNWRF